LIEGKWGVREGVGGELKNGAEKYPK